MASGSIPDFVNILIVKNGVELNLLHNFNIHEYLQRKNGFLNDAHMLLELFDN